MCIRDTMRLPIWSIRIDTVICNGKPLMRFGRLLTIDLQRVRAEVASRMKRLNQRAHDKRLATYPV
jgi:hypothetical protein